MKNYHIVPRNAGWELSEEGGAVLGTYETKDEAVKAAARIAANDPGSVKIHRADGTFEEERTYPRSADPSASPG
jgi:hypothetical protein